MSCRVERLTLFREYMLVAGGLYLNGNPAAKVMGMAEPTGRWPRLRI
jgi:hypothetical protein